MTTKPIKAEDVPVDLAQQVVDKAHEARKDGIAGERYGADGLVLKPDPNDNSVVTYDPAKPEYREEAEQKPSKNSGEPVHERS